MGPHHHVWPFCLQELVKLFLSGADSKPFRLWRLCDFCSNYLVSHAAVEWMNGCVCVTGELDLQKQAAGCILPSGCRLLTPLAAFRQVFSALSPLCLKKMAFSLYVTKHQGWGGLIELSWLLLYIYVHAYIHTYIHTYNLYICKTYILLNILTHIYHILKYK